MTTIITKNSSTASSVPASGDLVQGELAVNVTDKKLYTKDSGGTVQKLVGSLGNQESNAVAITGGSESGVAITGGTINNTPIGGTTASTVAGTTVTASVGFTGTLTGNVTGNVTGNTAGTHTGAVVGDVTGNVTASTGTSTFNDVVINGGLNMNAGTSATITNLTSPTNTNDAATKGYVDTAVSNLVASAPGTLDTLNELAAALGNDPSFATTVTNSIATKLPLAGGTMTGAIAMGTYKITGAGDPTANQDVATKVYVDTADAAKLSLSGGTMTGNIVMGANKVTSTATPTANEDLTTKTYVDSILGSATAAATSAAAAATSETNAANSATAAATSATNAASSFTSLDNRYLGSKSTAPTTDNSGGTLVTGAVYWNSTSNTLYVWNGTAWNTAAFDTSGALLTTDIGVTVQGYDANTAKLNVAQTFTTAQTFTAVKETKVAVAASDIDLSAGNYFTKTISGATTFTVSNVAASGSVAAFVLDLTNGGAAAVTWWSGITWNAATPPTLTASGVDTLAFFSYDGGTSWRGFVLGLGMA